MERKQGEGNRSCRQMTQPYAGNCACGRWHRHSGLSRCGVRKRRPGEATRVVRWAMMSYCRRHGRAPCQACPLSNVTQPHAGMPPAVRLSVEVWLWDTEWCCGQGTGLKDRITAPPVTPLPPLSIPLVP